MSPAHIGFEEVGASDEEPPEEIKGLWTWEKTGRGGNRLNDKPEPLLDSLNAWREKVAVGSS